MQESDFRFWRCMWHNIHCRIRAFDSSVTGAKVTTINNSHELDGSSDLCDMANSNEDSEPGIAYFYVAVSAK